MEWVKAPSSKNWDTLIALEDDHVLKNIYPPYQLLHFWLGAKLAAPYRGSVAQPRVESDSEEHKMDVDQPPALKDPLISNGLMQQLIGDVRTLFEQQRQFYAQFAIYFSSVAANYRCLAVCHSTLFFFLSSSAVVSHQFLYFLFRTAYLHFG